MRLLRAGHRAANHSWSHNLSFRSLPPDEMRREVWDAHQLISELSDSAPQGFRAPGYAASAQLTDLLDDLGYKYDGSLMPGPYGPVFRWMDRRLHAAEAPARLHPKTQYPLMSDAFARCTPPMHATKGSYFTVGNITTGAPAIPGRRMHAAWLRIFPHLLRAVPVEPGITICLSFPRG